MMTLLTSKYSSDRKVPLNFSYRLVLLSAILLFFGSPMADRTKAQDIGAIAIDLAQRAVSTYHPSAKESAMKTEMVNVQHSGNVVDTIVKIKWRYAGPSIRSRGRSATVRASFAYQSNRRFVLIYLDYVDECGRPIANRDRAAEIIAEYNIELERLAHIRGFSGWNSSHLTREKSDSRIACLFRRERIGLTKNCGKICGNNGSLSDKNDLREVWDGQSRACD